MKITRSLMRRIILKEIRELTRSQAPTVDQVISRFSSSSDTETLDRKGKAELIASKAKELENLDQYVLIISSDAKLLKAAIGALSEDEKQTLVDVIGMLRGDLSASAYTEIKNALLAVDKNISL